MPRTCFCNDLDCCSRCRVYETHPAYAEWAVLPKGRHAGCRHRGAETRRVQCPTCCGKVELKVFACAKHGECTPRRQATGLPCCAVCPDHEAPLRAADPGRIRHLLYHVYPHAAAGGAVWRWNVAKVKRRLSLFNGRRVIGIAVGPETEPAAAVRAALAGCGCEFVEAANDPSLREGTTFHALHEHVAAFTGPEHATLFAHAKGITSEAWAPGVRKWTETLYEACLDHWPAVRRLLASHPLVGPFKRLGFCFTEADGRLLSRSDWHYHGSWRWFRNADFFSRDWREIDRFWCGVEAHPSLHFRAEEAAGMVCEIPTGGLALYLEETWRGWAEAAVSRWREDHLADRWPPLLLTCVLVSHRKPRTIHEAVASVQAQTCPDWRLVVMDSGELLSAGEFDRYADDPRIVVVGSGETAELRSRVGIQAWCTNECFRRGLVQGDLVCFLCDDDVYDPGIFAVWQAAARCDPDRQAWYGPAARSEVRADGAEVEVGELPIVGIGGRGGVSLDCRIDGMQACCRRSVCPEWPEDRAGAWHADGLWLAELGRRTVIYPVAAKVGRHRHTLQSTFTRPGEVGANGG